MNKRGFTLIEIIIVIAILGLLMTVVALSLMSFREKQALENTANGLTAVLNEARTRTLSSQGGTQYGVKIETDQAILFSGANYDAGAAGNEFFSFDTPVSVTATLNEGATTILFERLTGATAQYGTITMQLPNGTTRTITVSATGTIARN